MAKPNFELIKSPYIVGNPIKSEGMFFGREEDFKIIQNWIIHNGPHVILLIGGRRSGKTSILWQILLGRLKEAGEAVLCDFHAIVPRIKKDEDFLLEIGKAILANQNFQQFEADFLTDDGTSWTARLQRLIQNCLEAIQPRRLIILCDEFDALEERFTSAVLSPESLLWVKQTLNQPVYFVMTGSHEFREDHLRAVFGAVSQNKPIYELSLPDALALIQKPVENRVTYKSEVPQLIYRLSGGHPFYVQYICHTLINYLNEQQRNYVVAKDLEEVVNFIVANPHGHIQETWRSLSHLKYVADTLAALANTINKPKEYVNTAALLKVIRERRFKITEANLYDTLAWLNQRTKLLEKDQRTQSYRFRIDLIRHWIAYNFQTGEDIELLDSPAETVVMAEGYGPTLTTMMKNKEEEYADRLEKMLLKTGFLTVHERLELDNFVVEYELDRNQADLLEQRVREKLTLKPRTWPQEYKDSCFYLKNLYSQVVPQEELSNLSIYISPDRLSSEKAREISKYVGLKPVTTTSKISRWVGIATVGLAVKNWYNTRILSKRASSEKVRDQAKISGGQVTSRRVYHRVGIAVGGVAIAGLILSPLFFKSMTISATDQEKPSGNLNGIKDHYRQGEEVTYTVNGNDNDALRQVTVTVVDSPTPVQNHWDASGQEFTQRSSFSTKEWPANKQYTYLLTVIDKTGNIFEKRGSFLLEEKVVPRGKISGFKNSYLVGEKIEGFVEVSKSEAVKTIIFTVANSPVKTTLSIQGHQPLAFSTQGWQPGTYPYSLIVTDKDGNFQEEKGRLVLAAVPVSPPVPSPAPPVANNGDSQKLMVQGTSEGVTKLPKDGNSQEEKGRLVPSAIPIPPSVPPVVNNDEKLKQTPLVALTEEVTQLLRECKKRYEDKRLAPGKDGTALACYQEVLTKSPNNPEAKDGLKQLETTYQMLVEQALKHRNPNDAHTYLQQLEEVNPTSAELPKLKQRLATLVPPNDKETSRTSPKPKPVPKPKVVEKPKPAPKPKVVEKPKPTPKPKVVEKPKPAPKPKVIEKPKPAPKPKVVEKPKPKVVEKPKPKAESKPKPKPAPTPPSSAPKPSKCITTPWDC
jgi:hypothetical protein